MNRLRGLHNRHGCLLALTLRNPESQVAGTLIPWSWLGFPFSAPWSQAVGLKGLLERIDDVKDVRLGRNASGKCRKAL